MKLHNPNQKFIKTSDPLQPTQEENNPKDESNVNSNLDYIITRSADEKKDSSGTDSSATIVSPKAVSAPSDLLIFSEKSDNSVNVNFSESHKSEKRLSGLSSPTSPSRRHLSCDISIDTNPRHMTLRSPPASSMLRSPPIRVIILYLFFLDDWFVYPFFFFLCVHVCKASNYLTLSYVQCSPLCIQRIILPFLELFSLVEKMSRSENYSIFLESFEIFQC